VLQRRARHGGEQPAHEVLRAAVAGRGVVDLLGLRLGQRDELLHVLRRHLGMHQQHVGRVDQLADGGEALDRVVAEVL
jgi:hypothetical protein